MNKYATINLITERGRFMTDYIRATDRIFYKHEVSENLPCDTYSMHTHSAYELIYFLDGDATHVIEDRKYKLKKGDLILIRPLSYHFIQIDTPAKYERYNILFDADRHGIESVKLIPDDLEVVNLRGNEIADDIFRKCDIYRKSCGDDVFERLLSHLLSELFYNVAMLPHPLPQKVSAVSPLISRALKYTNENLCTLKDIDEIAEHLFISESYLFRLFKKELHQTPKKYILEKRLLMAQKMIASGISPTAACEKCGFSDYTTFYRNYRSFFGSSPAKYR